MVSSTYEYLTLQNLIACAGFCVGCMFFSALITTIVYFTTPADPEVHWLGIFSGNAVGLLITNAIVVPAIRRRMAKRKEASDPS
jgi:hypothetical protein